MENLVKNITPSVSLPSGISCRITMIKAAGGVPLLKSMNCNLKGKDHPSYKHGLSHSREHNIWCGIRGRVLNPKYPSYHYYGGRGIQMYAPWIHDLKLFTDYIRSLPFYDTLGYTLDRINNDGNYEPGNLRWASKHIQSTNTKVRKNSHVGLIGTTKNKNKKNPWSSIIKVNNKQIFLGNFKTAREAAAIRDNYIVANNLTEYRLNNIN